MASNNSLLLFYAIFAFSIVTLGFAKIRGNEHRTKEAAEKQPDLSCYRCDTMVDGDRCVNISSSDGNATLFHHKCSKEDRICKVKKISWSTSTEDTTGKPELWSLQRNCTNTCEEGCIIIGERTKLYSCTSCCQTNFCNMGSGSENVHAQMFFVIFYLILSINSSLL